MYIVIVFVLNIFRRSVNIIYKYEYINKCNLQTFEIHLKYGYLYKNLIDQNSLSFLFIINKLIKLLGFLKM